MRLRPRPAHEPHRPAADHLLPPAPCPSPLPFRGFTLIEMLTTVAVLVIVLGLMVSLARDVRTRSADRLTRDLLRRLDTLVDQYRSRSLARVPVEQRAAYPAVHSLFDGVNLAVRPVDHARLGRNAAANNSDLVHTLRSQANLGETAFSDLSVANYTEVSVLDAWGSPVVYMPSQHPAIGMAAGDRSFFFSAGPDRNYLTRQDNLYSYEQMLPPGMPSAEPAIRPAAEPVQPAASSRMRAGHAPAT